MENYTTNISGVFSEEYNILDVQCTVDSKKSCMAFKNLKPWVQLFFIY